MVLCSSFGSFCYLHMAQTIELTEEKSELSDLLQPYIQSGSINILLGSGASTPAIPTSGNIEAELNTLLKEKGEAAANRRAVNFVQELAAINTALADSVENPSLTKTTDGYAEFVTTLDRILFERKNLLLPRQANLFTTNYDMFVEYAASRTPSLILNDGFSRTAVPGTEFAFAPERYFDRTYRSGNIYSHPSEIPTINLVKLHGSLSWRRKGDTVVYGDAPVEPLTPKEQADDDKVKAYLETYFLVLPNLSKFHSTLMDRIYYDLLRLFANSMDQENAILISFGFSFDDEHLLDITRRALRNPTAQLLIFAHTPDAAAKFNTKFANQRNATIVAPPAAETIEFARLNSLLTAALPAKP
jgi:hypothetical protein